jgi:hypothetical protein
LINVFLCALGELGERKDKFISRRARKDRQERRSNIRINYKFLIYVFFALLASLAREKTNSFLAEHAKTAKKGETTLELIISF